MRTFSATLMKTNDLVNLKIGGGLRSSDSLGQSKPPHSSKKLNEKHVPVLILPNCPVFVFVCVYPTDLQSAVKEAAVLSRLVAQAFAGCNRGHGSRGHQPLHPTCCSATRCKVVPLPRHHYLDAPVFTARRGRGGAADKATASMSLP